MNCNVLRSFHSVFFIFCFFPLTLLRKGPFCLFSMSALGDNQKSQGCPRHTACWKQQQEFLLSRGIQGALQAPPAQLSSWPWTHNTGPQFSLHWLHPPLGEAIPSGMIAMKICISRTLGQPLLWWDRWDSTCASSTYFWQKYLASAKLNATGFTFILHFIISNLLKFLYLCL